MPQTAEQISTALRGVSKRMKSKSADLVKEVESKSDDVAAMRTASSLNKKYAYAKDLTTRAKGIDEKASELEEANPTPALKKRNTAFADAVSGTTVKKQTALPKKLAYAGQSKMSQLMGVTNK